MGRRFLAALAGLLAGAVAVGVGELVAAFVRPGAAPVVAVGQRLVTLTPEPVRLWAIRSFGTADKTALLTGIYVVLAVMAAAIGLVASRRLAAGVAAIAVLAALGCASVATAAGAGFADLLPTLLGVVAGGVALAVLTRRLPPDRGDDGGPRPGIPATAAHDGPAPVVRRRFLLAALGAAVGAVVAGLAGRVAIAARFDVEARRRRVRLPPSSSGPAAGPAPPAAPGSAPVFPGTAWVTPASVFYRIDTELSPPEVDPDRWSLRIHGLVDREITLTYLQLLHRPLVERWITLCCVSNPVGGPLVGNTRWLGVLLAPLLRAAGVHRSADQLFMTSVDGFTLGAPMAAILDGRDAMVAIAMDGQPLPVEHGFPARVIIPGLYGYVSACKWVIDLEATTFAARTAFWIEQGWTQSRHVRLASRIDVPRQGTTVRVGRPTAVAGVAWDQHVGVSRVEVQIDGGAWRRAELGAEVSVDTWRQWYLPWTPTTAGSSVLRVRAFDGRGRPQDSVRRDPFPAGATGLHTVTVQAR